MFVIGILFQQIPYIVHVELIVLHNHCRIYSQQHKEHIVWAKLVRTQQLTGFNPKYFIFTSCKMVVYFLTYRL